MDILICFCLGLRIVIKYICLHFIYIVHFRLSTNYKYICNYMPTTCLLTLSRVGLGLVE